MKKKILSMLMVGAMATSLMMGCGSSSESTSDASSADAAESEAAVAQTEASEDSADEVATASGTVTFSIDMTQYDEGQTVKLWVPVAQDNDYQTVEDVSTDANGTEAEITEDENGNKMMYVEWDADTAASDRTASVSFHVTRQAVVSPELVEDGEVGEDMSEYLEASSTIPVTGEVKELADEITKDETTILGKTRAIYDWVIANMNRDDSVTGCGTGDVCTLLDTKAGKCTDISSVFIGLCRAAGVPARETFGIRINDTDITGNQHCWAEFYLPGTGWVIADPADVLKAVLKNDWDKDSDEAKELQEYYWGNCEETRIDLSSGRDITLSPAQDGEALNNFGYPYAEVNGEAVDYYSADTFIYTISYEADN
jgi:transglutaminase-like putative cysteine protease